MGNIGEQPPQYDLEKARAEADEMKKMKDTGEAKDYKEAGEKIESENEYKELIRPVSEVIPGINLEGLIEENVDGLKYEKAKNIKEHAKNDLATSYVSDIYIGLADLRKSQEKRTETKEIMNNFKDKIIVDLGAGDSGMGYMVADFIGAKHYIAIEPNNARMLLNGISRLREEVASWENYDYNYNHTPFSIVQEDMLNFLKRLPNDSVSILCSGIDYEILPDQKYRDETAEQIERVLDPKGAYIGNRDGVGGLGFIELKKSNNIEENSSKLLKIYKKTSNDLKTEL